MSEAEAATALQRRLDDVEAALLRKSAESSTYGHVIVESGIVPGISYPCRCDDCKSVAVAMAAAGYLGAIEDRWWESEPR